MATSILLVARSTRVSRDTPATLRSARHTVSAMTRFPRGLVVAALLLLGASVLPAPWFGVATAPARALVEAATAPIAHPLLWLGHAVRVPDPRELGPERAEALRRGYERMLQYTRKLEQELARARERIERLDQVRGHVELAEVGLISASVVGRPDRRGGDRVRINRGRADGVSAGQAVVSGAALVGRVTGVSELSATVRLITDPGTALTVRVVSPTPGEPERSFHGRLHGRGRGEPLRLRTGADQPVEVGDLAHLADAGWPRAARGFIVGEVRAVDEAPMNPTMYRRLRIEPIEHLATLRRVVVLRSRSDPS